MEFELKELLVAKIGFNYFVKVGAAALVSL